jgi:fluoride exporter
MKNFLLVFIGGGFGSAIRYGIARLLNPYTLAFPYATLVSNVMACFVLGLIVGLADSKQLIGSNARLFWAVGFCGGFSTFSTFSQETLHLLNAPQQLMPILYVILSVTLCLTAVFTAQWLMKP